MRTGGDVASAALADCPAGSPPGAHAASVRTTVMNAPPRTSRSQRRTIEIPLALEIGERRLDLRGVRGARLEREVPLERRGRLRPVALAVVRQPQIAIGHCIL